MLLVAVIFINRSKINFIRRILAERLRQKILSRMNALLPMLLKGYRSTPEDMFAFYKLKADLESYVQKADVLYQVEHRSLVSFLTQLSTYIAQYETQTASSHQAEGLILAGQRLVNEINELK